MAEIRSTNWRRILESSSSCESDCLSMMQEIQAEAEAILHPSKSLESEATCEDKSEKSATRSNSEQGDSDGDVVVRQTRTLLSRIDDFRQSYNRTHGQVCEFFERARAVQKLGLLDTSQAAQLVALSGDEADDDDCNSLVDGNYADGQKTTGMKRKLRKWRKVMRSALMEICPELGLENQPDINPGLMKHVLDEVRNLKSQLAFQHSHILQLARQTEMYKLDSKQKEQFISDLLQNCKGIRLDSLNPMGTKDAIEEGAPSFGSDELEEPPMPLPAKVEDIQFGHSKELITSLRLDTSAMGCSDAEHVVVDPIDFASAQKQLQLIAKQNSAAANDAGGKSGDSAAPSYLSGVNTRRHRELHGLDLQARLATGDFQAERSTGPLTTNNPSHSRTPTHSRPISATVPKRRQLFMNVGGGITAAVLGGLALNSFHRRGQD